MTVTKVISKIILAKVGARSNFLLICALTAPRSHGPAPQGSIVRGEERRLQEESFSDFAYNRSDQDQVAGARTTSSPGDDCELCFQPAV